MEIDAFYPYSEREWAEPAYADDVYNFLNMPAKAIKLWYACFQGRSQKRIMTGAIFKIVTKAMSMV